MILDVLAALVADLSEVPELRGVFVELPHGRLHGPLPVVHLESAGPARRLPSLQSLGVDSVGVDVNLFISERDWKTGLGTALAGQLRSRLSTFRCGLARAVDVSRPELWPSLNDSTRRLGMTVEVMVPADL